MVPLPPSPPEPSAAAASAPEAGRSSVALGVAARPGVDSAVWRAGTDAILTAPGDILYCGFVGAEGIRGHYGDNDFGAAPCRISRKVLESMPPPWFRFPTNAAGTVRTTCECASFRARAARRFPIRMERNRRPPSADGACSQCCRFTSHLSAEHPRRGPFSRIRIATRPLIGILMAGPFRMNG
jgi:hypothetical protein